jgi:predicted ArsR family transcriptional regulator
MTRPGPDPSVAPVDVVRVIVAARPPALGTADLADEFDLSSEAMRRRLHRLDDDGYLHSDTVGGALVWWPTEDGRALLTQV